MDSISRSALLSVLRSQTMTQEEIIKLIEDMQPLEVDSTQGRVPDRRGHYMIGSGLNSDLMNWPLTILGSLG